MATPETKHDYHYTLRGTYTISPEKMNNLVMYNVKRTGFLRIDEIIEVDESTRKLRIVSDRKEDPKGIIDFEIKDWTDKGSHFRMRIEDEEFLAAVRADGLQARYGKGCKHEDTIGGLLIREPPGAKERTLVELVLNSYGQMTRYVPMLREGMYGLLAPGGKEMVELVELVEKYRDVYPAQKAQSIAKEIQDLRYSVDAEASFAAIVKKEEDIVTVSLAIYKKFMEWQLAMFAQVPSTAIPGHVKYNEDAMKQIEEIARRFELTL